jgi:catechol 2,3-dioxygenase-like lactoylglutathione lyase family enzyme
MTTVSVRYITDDVDAAVDFYDAIPAPGLGTTAVGHRLSRAARAGPIEQQPQVASREHRKAGSGPHLDVEAEPLGVQIEVSNLGREVEALREAGASFRNDIVTGRGGSQILLEDPSGNPIELFQPAGA